MAYDHAATRRMARGVVHDTLAEPATYYDDSLAAPVELRVRWHHKLFIHGDIKREGYGGVVDSTDRIVFDPRELFIKGLEIVHGGVVTMTGDGQKLYIDTLDNLAGPGEEIWLVGKG